MVRFLLIKKGLKSPQKWAKNCPFLLIRGHFYYIIHRVTFFKKKLKFLIECPITISDKSP